MTDYIIVGCGLAGMAFAETALKNQKSVLVICDRSQNASFVAGGLYNPVILKRFSALQNAQQQIFYLNSFYSGLEAKLDIKIKFELPVLRKFFSVEEQNNWFAASDKPGLSPFLSAAVQTRQYEGIDAPYSYGEVLQTGYVDTAKLLAHYHEHLRKADSFVDETFDYGKLRFENGLASYKDIRAKHLVFAEGFGVHANPFFNFLPLNGTKGELFIIRAPALNLDVVVKGSVFILPLGNHLFKVGATYNWTDKTSIPTEAGRQELIGRIGEILNCDFEIVEHLAGIRPTVKDRRPLLGTHPDHPNLHILNGLGTRGVMLGPYMAQKLFDHIESGIPLERENNITRFMV